MTDRPEDREEPELLYDPDGNADVLRPPRADAAPSRAEAEQQWAVPGTVRGDEIERAEAQQGPLADFEDGLAETAAGGLVRTWRDEAGPLREDLYGDTQLPGMADAALDVTAGALSLFGFRAGEADYDREEMYEELTEGVPFEFHDDIMENDNLAAARRARARVLNDMNRGRRIAQQDSGQLAVLAGSLFDIDMPLTAFSGGAYAAARVSRAALQASRMARLSPRAALRVSGVAQGVNAGGQAGAIVGAVDAYNRETVGWQDMSNMILQSMALGGGIGGALRGDVRLSVREAEREFHERVSRDDPAYRDEVNVNEMRGDDLSEFTPDPDAQGGSVGAAQATTNIPNGQFEPVQGATPTNQEWIDMARQWDQDTGFSDRLDDALDEGWWARVAMHPVMNATTNNFTRLIRSESRVARFIGGNIFESANGLGRGRATAATRMENYHRRIQSYLGEEVRGAMQDWARDNGMTLQGSGFHISQDGQRVFSREVMLELNDRRMGRTSARNPQIKRAADQYELAGIEALNIGRGRDGETPVDGFDMIPDSRGYTPYKWSGGQIERLEAEGVVTRDDIVRALAQSYRDAGMAAGKDADAVAKAVIHRAITKADDIDTSVLSMLSGDGKDFIREAMVLSGMDEAAADGVINRLAGAQHNRSKESFAKTRNDVDMNTRIRTQDGSDLRIVDLLDQDMHGVWQRYARQMSGSAALARHGITNRAKRREIIDAMRAEQRALGEDPIDAELIEAMFSHFNAGPVHGYGLRGGTNEGIGHLALAKRIANLALLEKLGATQIAETGVIMAQNGLANWMTRGPMAVFSREIRQGNKELLDDLAYMTGQIGQEHWHFAQWLDLDDMTRTEKGDWLHTVNRYTQQASFIQGYTSLFNQVRSFQQQTAALGVTDKVFRTLKAAIDEGRDLSPNERGRFENDLGLGRTELAELEDLIHSGLIEFQTRGNSTFVNKLNMDQWPDEIAEVFASSVTRNINQLVQKSMAGEQDAWMHTHMGSLLMHLKTFPLQALQKQVMRNARFLDKQSVATVLMGMATAAVAVQVRDVLDGREQRDVGELAKAAFNYSNMTGFIPTFVDPMMSLVGMDNARINQYGPHYDITPPTLRVANDMMRIPGALVNTIRGDTDWYDGQALKAIPFAGTYVLSRAFD